MTEVDDAITTAGTSRRAIFRGAGGLAALAAFITPAAEAQAQAQAEAAENGDAALIALADEAERIRAAWMRLIDPAEDDPLAEVELRRLQTREGDIADEAGDIPAASMAGWRAKCRIALIHGGIACENWAGAERFLATSLIRDILPAADIERIERARNGVAA